VILEPQRTQRTQRKPTIVVVLLCVLCVLCGSIPAHAQPSPLDRAHAHNDYEHERPLLGALERGLGSVEVDIYLVNGALLVAHARDSVRADLTLESLYLEPLRAWVASHGGRVYPHRPPLTLLVDVKSHADSTYAVLDSVLRGYDDLFTSWHGGAVTARPVVAVISGERPLVALPAQPDRWAALDGRLADLDTTHVTRAAMPLVSDDWKRVSAWRGGGPAPADLRRRLTALVRRAHAQGRRLRFWNTPDLPVVWRVLYDAGVDLLGADDLDALREFLTARRR